MWSSFVNDKSKNGGLKELAKPGLVASTLFLLLFSGPPRFRYRDPTASLEGEIDTVVIVHAIVWGLAGIWILSHFLPRSRRPWMEWRLVEKASALFICWVWLSVIESAAPFLTAFRAYQMSVGFLFVALYIHLYGIEKCLEGVFWSSFLLCLGIAISALVVPDLVNDTSETGVGRLRGELIADTGSVSALSIILLLGWMRRLWKPLFVFAFLLSFSLLIFSLERTAYAAVLGFAALAVLKSSGSRATKWIAGALLLGVGVFLSLGGMGLLGEFRDPDSIWTLSDRLGLWAYLSAVVMAKAPWTGLGYYAASREYGPDYNPALGTAHSMFVEALVGAGIPALILLVALCAVLVLFTAKELRRGSRFSLPIAGLAVCVLFLGSVGGSIDAGPVAITFWAVAKMLSEESRKRVPRFVELHLVTHGMEPSSPSTTPG